MKTFEQWLQKDRDRELSKLCRETMRMVGVVLGSIEPNDDMVPSPRLRRELLEPLFERA